jgi:hypothetical protein
MVMIPIEDAVKEQGAEGIVSGVQFGDADRRSQSLPFKRGIMNFDDFNYNAYNKHVLVKPPIEPID